MRPDITLDRDDGRDGLGNGGRPLPKKSPPEVGLGGNGEGDYWSGGEMRTAKSLPVPMGSFSIP